MALDLLLHPIEGSPCGDDLSFSPVFDEILEARRSDDPSLSQGDWVAPLKEADWGKVVQLCRDALALRAKDLRLAGWLTEALGRTKGFGGLAEGFGLLAGLCGRYWEDVHPKAEDGDFELRVGSLDWLLAQSERVIREIPVTDSPRGCFTLADLESARKLAAAQERNPEETGVLLRSAPATLQVFEEARRETRPHYFLDALEQVRAAQAALEELATVVGARLPEDGPAFEGARRALAEASDTFTRYSGGTQGVSPRVGVSEPSNPVHATPAAGTGEASIRSRAEALARLREIAEFFRRTEPHSPVAYLADKAARWGDMPLHEWLQSVVRDEGALAHVEELLGVRRVPEA